MDHARRTAAALVALAGCLGSGSAQGLTTIVSVDSGDVPGNGASRAAAICADGRYVAFRSLASNLVPGDSNGESDVFVRDRLLGTTSRVSVDSAGGQGMGGDCWGPALSADGRYVGFTSSFVNLVPGDANGWHDVFVHDRVSGETVAISVTPSGQVGNWAADGASLSADGRFVAFDSLSSDLVPGDTNQRSDVFVRDRQNETTERVSVSSSGVQGEDGHSTSPAISSDGRFVAFQSSAVNLVPGDTNGRPDIFVHDRWTGATTRVSVSSSGEQTNDDSSSPSISADGVLVAFDSRATNLVAGDTNSRWDAFVHDRATGTTTRVSVASSGNEGNDHSSGVEISEDGRFVVFHSGATNLVPGDTNARGDVFAHDLATGKTTRASVGPSGVQGNDDSVDPMVSGDGRLVAFSSYATNLVAGDDNFELDVFVHDRAPREPTPFCFGHGGGTPCPCGNDDSGGQGGCANGTGAGAVLGFEGSTSIAAGDLVLVATKLPPSQAVLFFQGSQVARSGDGTPFGDGLLCFGGSLVRLEIVVAGAGGSAATSVDIAAAGGVAASGRYGYQAWYRDPVTGPCSTHFNLSNALLADWTP